MWITAILIGITTGLVVWLVSARKKQFQVFKEMGIPGPSPNFFLGNMIAIANQGFLNMYREWNNKYGGTFGYFDGPIPILVTDDLELLKGVFIKEFQKFNVRKKFIVGPNREDDLSMISTEFHRWKRVRSVCSPSFSTRRMKEMSGLVNVCVDNLMMNLEEVCKKGKPVEIHGQFQRLTLDSIGACAFGIETNSADMPEEDNVYLQQCKEIFKLYASQEGLSNILKLTFALATMFPAFAPQLKTILWTVRGGSPKDWFYNLSAQMIEERKQKKNMRIDFIQLLIDAEVETNNDESTLDMTIDESEVKQTEQNGSNGRKTTKQQLTNEEIKAQCMLFLLVGYETTSTLLGYAAYELALNPEHQKKLQEEIDEKLPEPNVADYENIQALTYLHMFLCETLRLHPISSIVMNRECLESCTISKIHFKKGIIVQADLEAIHMNKEYWGPEDPKLCVPERFTPERKAARDPLAWVPFGIGPRNCIGMRFALLEAKLALVAVMRKYSFVRCKETQIPLRINKVGVFTPADGVYVHVEERA